MLKKKLKLYYMYMAYRMCCWFTIIIALPVLAVLYLYLVVMADGKPATASGIF